MTRPRPSRRGRTVCVERMPSSAAFNLDLRPAGLITTEAPHFSRPLREVGILLAELAKEEEDEVPF